MVQNAEAEPIFGRAMEERDVLVLDLSVGSPELGTLEATKDVVSFESLLHRLIAKSGATIGVGRYAEPRLLYDTGHFKAGPGSEPRTVHLGVDLFAPSGTEVRAPLAGAIVSATVNAGELDYGPTIILEHRLDGQRFYSLYGHLSPDSLDGKEPGSTVSAGDSLATIGDYPANGNWPPHLHFQIFGEDLVSGVISPGSPSRVRPMPGFRCAPTRVASWESRRRVSTDSRSDDSLRPPSEKLGASTSPRR